LILEIEQNPIGVVLAQGDLIVVGHKFLDKRLVEVAESLYLFDRFLSSCAFVEGMVLGH
jgi:hypothetical protein